MKKTRIIEIDALRGIAIIAMIAIHATSYFLSDPLARFVWNLLQFAVVVFVFCSAYLTASHHAVFNSMREVLIYLKKRVVRLLRPFYIYLAFILPLIALYEPKSLSGVSLFRTMTLTTSANDITWLILLFVMFAFITPFIVYTARLHKIIFWAFAAVSFASSLFFLFVKPAMNFKFVMFAPWSLVAVAAWYGIKRQPFSKTLALTAGVAWIGTYALLNARGASLVHFDNKYPPNLYHLSYGLMWVGILWALAGGVVSKLPRLLRFLSFLSRHSYSIYFIHFVFLYIFVHFFASWTFAFGWGVLFTALLTLSCLVQFMVVRLRNQSAGL